jgi:tellurite resistance protein TerC
MIWFWFGFFALVGLLLFLDLGVIHRKAEAQSIKSAAMWTVGWMILGLSFAGIVYLIFEHHWLGAHLKHEPKHASPGGTAAVTYVSAYLLEQALSIDNIFVIALLFRSWRIPEKYQHRVLFWGILGAIVFRVSMLGGGVWLASRFDWIFYIFGGYLAWQGLKLFKPEGDDDEEDPGSSRVVKWLRTIVPVVDGDHGGHFTVRMNGKRALTIVAVCLVTVELTDIVFALDSIPAVLSVSEDSFIVITSNIFAIMGLRSLYFVLQGAMAKFQFLKYALGFLLVGIGLKMILHKWVHIGHGVSLLAIAGILAVGVLASVIDSKRNGGGPSEPKPASPSP